MRCALTGFFNPNEVALLSFSWPFRLRVETGIFLTGLEVAITVCCFNSNLERWCNCPSLSIIFLLLLCYKNTWRSRRLLAAGFKHPHLNADNRTIMHLHWEMNHICGYATIFWVIWRLVIRMPQCSCVLVTAQSAHLARNRCYSLAVSHFNIILL